MRQPIVMVGRPSRKKVRAYKRLHKAARIQEQLRERAAAEKAAAHFDRKLGRSAGRVEAAFKGCEL